MRMRMKKGWISMRNSSVSSCSLCDFCANVGEHRLISQNIDPEDHATLDTLALGAEAGSGSRTLADIIFSKMEGGAATAAMDDEGVSCSSFRQ